MEQIKLTVKDSSLSFVVGFFLSQLATVVAMCFATIFMKLSNRSFDVETFFNSAVGYLILSLSLYVTIVCVFLFFNKKKNNKITAKPKVNKILLYILIAIISFLTLYPIVTCFDSLLNKLNIKINTLSYGLSTKNYFISLISLVFAPAICEELLFRGLIFKGLKKYGKVFSITISSLMFCLFHMAISQTIYPLLMGILLSVIMYYENNIYYCMVVHLTNNFLSLTLSYFKINLIFNHWSYIVLAIALCAGFITALSIFAIKNNKTSKQEHLNKLDKTYLFSSLGIMCLMWIIINLAWKIKTISKLI